MERPVRFEHYRFVGDKRTQLVYDLDTWTDTAVIDELMEAETYICFGPDTIVLAQDGYDDPVGPNRFAVAGGVVTIDDPEFAHYRSIKELPPHWIKQVKRFFEDYKALEMKTVKVNEFLDAQEALGIVKEAQELYRAKPEVKCYS